MPASELFVSIRRGASTVIRSRPLEWIAFSLSTILFCASLCVVFSINPGNNYGRYGYDAFGEQLFFFIIPSLLIFPIFSIVALIIFLIFEASVRVTFALCSSVLGLILLPVLLPFCAGPALFISWVLLCLGVYPGSLVASCIFVVSLALQAGIHDIFGSRIEPGAGYWLALASGSIIFGMTLYRTIQRLQSDALLKLDDF